MSEFGGHGANIEEVHTEQKRALMVPNYRVSNDNLESGFYVYAQANGAIAEGAHCRLSYLGQADTITDAESGSDGNITGIAQKTLADDEWGWFWRGLGTTQALVQTGISAGAVLTCTSSAGELGAGGDAVKTLFAGAGNSSGSTALTRVVAYGFLGTN
jgi:hypothetical protein